MTFGVLKGPSSPEGLEPNTKYKVKSPFALQCAPNGGGSLVRVELKLGDEIEVHAAIAGGFNITVAKNGGSSPFKDVKRFFLSHLRIPDLLSKIEKESGAVSGGWYSGLVLRQTDIKIAANKVSGGHWKKRKF